VMVPSSMVMDILGIVSGISAMAHHSFTSAAASRTMSSTCGTAAFSRSGL
jgi:predicted component of type VI protein secretion system